MEHSETFVELTKALAQAQGDFPPVPKSRTNPHLKNKYATLDDVINTIRAPLKAHGLSFVQPLSNGTDGAVVLETIIMHESGEWISTTAHVPAMGENRGVNELQSFGAALTYMRRYMLTAMLGISSEEDGDGQKATRKRQSAPRQSKNPPPPQKAKSNGDAGGYAFTASQVKAVIEAGHAENPPHVTRMLNLSKVLSPTTSVQLTVDWAGYYRRMRDEGKEAKDAAMEADKWIPKEAA
jgi:hypothetical protein